eukprot:TRINITY_DN4169_c0_g1_i1.p2 TRINITY_DN4169_c0_g1~~TRINITY_DN4169_c0_g1_i1.p2  ORF type:complete len:201 (+),score=59.95 TRINITY_DN4169_c0_g1_i1:239-841(+)
MPLLVVHQRMSQNNQKQLLQKKTEIEEVEAEVEKRTKVTDPDLADPALDQSREADGEGADRGRGEEDERGQGRVAEDEEVEQDRGREAEDEGAERGQGREAEEEEVEQDRGQEAEDEGAERDRDQETDTGEEIVAIDPGTEEEGGLVPALLSDVGIVHVPDREEIEGEDPTPETKKTDQEHLTEREADPIHEQPPPLPEL